jgi:hypothetical protein
MITEGPGCRSDENKLPLRLKAVPKRSKFMIVAVLKGGMVQRLIVTVA